MKNLLKRFWPHKQQDPPTKGASEDTIENPYARAWLFADTHELMMRQSIRSLRWGVVGLCILLGGLLYGNIYQMRQAKEFHHFILIDKDLDTVSALSRRADLMTDEDPIKKATARHFVEEYVTKSRQRMMDKSFVADGLTIAQTMLGGTALRQFQTEYVANQVELFKRVEREKIIVRMHEGSPFRAGANVWQANWTERVENAGGDVTGEYACAGNFQVGSSEKRVSLDNPFGFVIVAQEKQCSR